jgi:hypothetical protein
VRRALNPVRDVVRVGLAGASARARRIGPFPDYLVIGAQRSGTTWLHEVLVTHPDVVAPRTKEVHYFDRHWHRSLDWYRANFAPAAAASNRRAAAQRPSPGQGTAHSTDRCPENRLRTGEATPYTVFHPLGASRVATTLPSVRLIVVLRDPVERAWSHWRHACALGVEREPFARAIALEEQRLAGAEDLLRTRQRTRHRSHQYHSYVARGRYARQLQNWFDHFERSQLLVVWSDDLFHRPAVALAQVTSHLGLAPFPAVPPVVRAARPAAPIDRVLAAELGSRFEDDDQALAGLLGVVPPWRR